MRSPDPHPFLGASDAGEPDVVLIGVPFDGGVSFRGGAREGPSGIRRFSESIETYSPRRHRDLAELRIADLGDLDHLDEIPDAPSALLVSLGGDHSVTPRLVRAVASRTEGLSVVGFDAHLDLRERYEGDHACTYRRIADGGVPCRVLGPRSGAREEWDASSSVLAYVSPGLELPPFHSPDGPVYLTIDIDVLDASCAPGTGNPEPAGPSFAQLLEAIEALGDLDVVALDVVEVSPPLDPSGITQVSAAVLVRELILLFARAR